ncbi:BREX-1 system adenine-specific DNA-methyltransferase PglX [Thauera aromatica]|uniref:BREX-1 system adenine-specific DNA-methyltransferase PglX n=1 Tax=Thauera aromatica TaxID=59405 RepID=UPI001FFD9C44|nr:BREX-1 system adenine-specific DNA-methyltransferase PglX [Thauera aromatica]MCK2097634.1 BREX-1 system adenine-specific DNA-methyltransferase PglX [Thauera aromatica]
MNKAKLKTYAPQARKDFIAAVTQRANLLGLSESAGRFEALPAERRGDVVLIAGREWPARVAPQRERLVRRIQRDGFGYTMEAVAYTWFNRFAALRYMELHDYLGHGHRVLSSATAGGLPDILTHAADLAASRELPGLDAAHIAELKLVGNKDGELYRLLLVAQCNALSAAMPFLFERIDDETELLLPDNLLRTDSVIAKLVAEIPEEDWAEVEIIGWLYQFYISEKKDQVIGKVVKSEDIPAATQLFTPNWIVQYLVQNSVGRLWLMANPASTLKTEWPYYIEPAEQTPEVGAALAAITQARMDEDGGSLNPESITVLDPACGSGHILVEAYALLKGIYLERGYRLRDIPRLILEKNLYGLDIDDRAAQLAGFALLMKARADDRRLFNDPPRLKVLSLQESKGLELDELATHLAPFGVERATVKVLLDTFEHAKTFGSLIQVQGTLNAQLSALAEALGKADETGDLYAQAAARDLLPLVEQAKVLGRQFDTVVANPPYMGGGFKRLKDYVKQQYTDESADLFACFIKRGIVFSRRTGFSAMITLQSWMYSSSYEQLRASVLRDRTIVSLVHVGFNSFPSLNSKIALGAMFVLSPVRVDGFEAAYVDLNSADKSADKEFVFKSRTDRIVHNWDQSVFERIPGFPISYSFSLSALKAFDGKKLADVGVTRRGLQTGDRDRFIRYWHECDVDSIELRSIGRIEASKSPKRWFLFNNGGDFRRWYGNVDLVVFWRDDGKRIKDFSGSIVPSESLYFEEAVCWSRLTYNFGFRIHPKGAIPGDLSPCFYAKGNFKAILAYMNSSVAEYFINGINPSLTKAVGDVAKIPMPEFDDVLTQKLSVLTDRLVEVYREDWGRQESALEFDRSNIRFLFEGNYLSASFDCYLSDSEKSCRSAQEMEREINALIVNKVGVASECPVEVPVERISLLCNPVFRYGAQFDEVQRNVVMRSVFTAECVSYVVGCMMGRYSLDEPGLIYARAGNVGFDSTRYKTFPADADGIVPLTDEFWFEDDAANRVSEFLRAVWGAETLDENMAWLAESLGTRAGETPDETIRRYLADKFFKDHLQTYKRRPIYWLFSSGKQGAFQALVYLHRYHEGTLARLRAEYVVPLTGKMQARIDMLEKDAAAASSTAARNKLNKQIEKLRKKHVELLAYDEKLRHYADMRIRLDLDDGVKVNYGKFGDLLAEVKAVTGGAGDE